MIRDILKWLGITFGAVLLLFIITLNINSFLQADAIQQVVGISARDIDSTTTKWDHLGEKSDHITISSSAETAVTTVPTSALMYARSLDDLAWGVVSSSLPNSDIIMTPVVGPRTAPQNLIFAAGGGTFARQRSANSGDLTVAVSRGVTLMAPLSTWSVTHTPAAGAQATATKAAGGPGVRNVSTHITACAWGEILPSTVHTELLDGATVVWTVSLQNPADDAHCVTTPITIVGTLSTAMTLAFTAGGGISTRQTVTLTGYSVDAN